VATRKRPVITIDGPAGAGKSTVARAVAGALGFSYLDTGAIYRTVALAAQRSATGWCDEPAVARIARDVAGRRRLRFETAEGGAQRVLLDGEDVSEAIRAPEMGAGASMVSALPAVRDALLDLQRDLARGGGVVMEGRDTGTVVMPDAELKFFLTAAPSERARRRCEEMRAKGMKVDLRETEREIEQRDRRDTERAAAPLRQAHDALAVDTTGLSIDAVTETLVRRARAAGA
jgi:cytidylate kinase